jgi:hypothetical protein
MLSVFKVEREGSHFEILVSHKAMTIQADGQTREMCSYPSLFVLMLRAALDERLRGKISYYGESSRDIPCDIYPLRWETELSLTVCSLYIRPLGEKYSERSGTYLQKHEVRQIIEIMDGFWLVQE